MPNLFAFVIYIICLNFISCNYLKKSNDFDNIEKITKAFLLSDIPSFDLASKEIRHFPDSAIIYSFKDYIVYNSYKIHRFYKSRKLADKTELEMDNEIKISFFYVFKQTDQIGYYFDSISAIPKIVRMDTFFKKNSPKLSVSPDFENYFALEYTNHNNGQIEKAYSAKEINPGGSKDSLILSFSELKSHLNYYISKPINLKFGFNLVKIKMILNGFYDDAKKIDVPKLETFIELRKSEISEQETKIVLNLLSSLKSLH